MTDSGEAKVTLRLTVSQSVCLGVVPHLGHMTRNLFIYLNFKKVTVLSVWAPSLRRGRVCRLSVICVRSLSVCMYSVFTKFIKQNTRKCFMYSINKASVSPGSVQQIVPYF
jgi:hypothetical protein